MRTNTTLQRLGLCATMSLGLVGCGALGIKNNDAAADDDDAALQVEIDLGQEKSARLEEKFGPGGALLENYARLADGTEAFDGSLYKKVVKTLDPQGLVAERKSLEKKPGETAWRLVATRTYVYDVDSVYTSVVLTHAIDAAKSWHFTVGHTTTRQEAWQRLERDGRTVGLETYQYDAEGRRVSVESAGVQLSKWYGTTTLPSWSDAAQSMTETHTITYDYARGEVRHERKVDGKSISVVTQAFHVLRAVHGPSGRVEGIVLKSRDDHDVATGTTTSRATLACQEQGRRLRCWVPETQDGEAKGRGKERNDQEWLRYTYRYVKDGELRYERDEWQVASYVFSYTTRDGQRAASREERYEYNAKGREVVFTSTRLDGKTMVLKHERAERTYDGSGLNVTLENSFTSEGAAAPTLAWQWRHTY